MTSSVSRSSLPHSKVESLSEEQFASNFIKNITSLPPEELQKASNLILKLGNLGCGYDATKQLEDSSKKDRWPELVHDAFKWAKPDEIDYLPGQPFKKYMLSHFYYLKELEAAEKEKRIDELYNQALRNKAKLKRIIEETLQEPAAKRANLESEPQSEPPCILPTFKESFWRECSPFTQLDMDDVNQILETLEKRGFKVGPDQIKAKKPGERWPNLVHPGRMEVDTDRPYENLSDYLTSFI